MVKFYFTVKDSAEMIRTGRKNSTIRILKPKTRRSLENTRKLHLYKGPWYSSDQSKIADAELIGITDIFIPLGSFIDEASEDLVYHEGFGSKEEMRQFFVRQYGEPILQECTFSLIEFKTKGWCNDHSVEAVA